LRDSFFGSNILFLCPDIWPGVSKFWTDLVEGKV
jgi:hypothetical protein